MKVCRAIVQQKMRFTYKNRPGPQGIPGSVPFEPGHTVSNEPGFYLEGHWGIRTESVLICKAVKVRNTACLLSRQLISTTDCAQLLDAI
jgi:Xaa-Pro aminopeptidase